MRSNKIILTISICLNAFYLSAQQESNNYFEIVRQSDEYYKRWVKTTRAISIIKVAMVYVDPYSTEWRPGKYSSVQATGSGAN